MQKAIILCVLLLPSSGFAAWKETILYTFQGGADGSLPLSALVADSQGNLYGTTDFGGNGFCGAANTCGTVFQLTPPSSQGGLWTKTTIYNFQGGTDGQSPFSGLILDGSGNLYGTTYYGGTGSCSGSVGCGTVYELSPPKSAGDPWTETVLYSFQGYPDGNFPEGGLVFDKNGNLYGSTTHGGEALCEGYYEGLCGTVFELRPPTTQGGSWTERVIHSFGKAYDGEFPGGGLLIDSSGALYGTTSEGGPNSCSASGIIINCGTVFRLSPPASGAGEWSESAYAFSSQFDGAFPSGSVALGPDGKIYGTTTDGGGGANQCEDAVGAIGCGEIFQLTPPASDGDRWTKTTLYEFGGKHDGAYSLSGVIIDSTGNLYGTASSGGGSGPCNGEPKGCGTVFKLSPPSAQGGSWTETTLHRFAAGNDGSIPKNGLLLGSQGELFGVSSAGGAANSGVVFRIRIQ